MVKVYSRSPLSHVFAIVDKQTKKVKKFVIYGTNRHAIPERDFKSLVYPPGCTHPKVTHMDKEVFEAIKDKYKNHLKLFGGIDRDGVKHDAQIYLAENDNIADRISKDSDPIFNETQIASQTKDIEPLQEK